MECAATDETGERRITARPGGVARKTSERLGIYCPNNARSDRSSSARTVRSIHWRIWRAFPPNRGGPQLSSCTTRRVGGTYRTNDADGAGNRAVISTTEYRSFGRRHFVSRLRQTLGKCAAGERICHELR